MASTRRGMLGALAAGLGVSIAGCVGQFASRSTGSQPERADERIEGTWSTNDCDAANTRRANVSGLTTEPTQRWKRTVPGRVFGDPVVDDSLVFVNGEMNGALTILEAATGDTYRTADDVRMHGSVSVVDGTMYGGVATQDGQLIAARDPTTGDRRWSRSVDTVPRSPSVVDDTVYSATVPNGTVHGIDADDDGEQWQYETVDVSSELAVAADTVAFTAGSHVFALDSGTGERRWNVRLDALSTGLHTPAPVVADGRIVVGTNAGAVALDSSGESSWSVDVGGEEPPSLASDGDVVYAGTTTDVSAIDAESGETLWTAADVAGATSLTITDAVVYACAERTVSAIDRSDGDVHWTKRLDERISFGLSALEDAIVVVTGSDSGSAEEPTSTIRALAAR